MPRDAIISLSGPSVLSLPSTFCLGDMIFVDDAFSSLGAFGHCQNQHMNKFCALLNGIFQASVDWHQHAYALLFLFTGILLQAFQVLGSLGVNVQMISQGASKVYTLSSIELCLSPSTLLLLPKI